MKRHRILVKPLSQHADRAAIGLGDDTTKADFLAWLAAQRAAVSATRTLADLREVIDTDDVTDARS